MGIKAEIIKELTKRFDSGSLDVSQSTRFDKARFVFEKNTSVNGEPEEETEVLSDTGRKTTEGRPIFENQWGDFVTERTITITDPSINNGQPTNIPTVFSGTFLTDEQAINLVIGANGKDPITGRDLLGFDSIEEAVSAAKGRSANIPSDLFSKNNPSPNVNSLPESGGSLINSIIEELRVRGDAGLITPQEAAIEAFQTVRKAELQKRSEVLDKIAKDYATDFL